MHVVSWALFAIWLAFTVVTNIPYTTSRSIVNDPSSALHEPFNEYGTITVISGWPFAYMECTITRSRARDTLNYFPLRGLLNLFIATIAHMSIVVLSRYWARQFTIKSLLLLIAAISVFLGIGLAVFATTNADLHLTFLIAVYLSPAFFAFILLIIHSRDQGSIKQLMQTTHLQNWNFRGLTLWLTNSKTRRILPWLVLVVAVTVYAFFIHKTERISTGMSHDTTMQSLKRLGGEYYELAALPDPDASAIATIGVTGTEYWKLEDPAIALGLFYYDDKLESIKIWYHERERFHPSLDPHEDVSEINFPRVRYFFTTKKLAH